MTLPFGPPLKPMLAKVKEEIPRGEGWVYEPKWDGFRAVVFRDGDEIYVASRNDRPLGRYFPEIETLLKESLPDRAIVDGEIIMPSPVGLEFDVLQLGCTQRSHASTSSPPKRRRASSCSTCLPTAMTI